MQFNLVRCYQLGTGVKKDEIKAFELYKIAAEKESSNVQFNLGYLYEYGIGTEKDLEKAIHWFNKAAENGNVLA